MSVRSSAIYSIGHFFRFSFFHFRSSIFNFLQFSGRSIVALRVVLTYLRVKMEDG